ncbi:GYDIA family GHMP kinase [Bizionia sediminis]|uniref:GYDIA family GHMP kinase n=1 Tax=Bizionia sediminis TaxID=1737064 RepID=A0ABW5KW14_9FLAO
MTNYYSHGKVLLTGEYVVLDGALALALPTIYGQSLAVSPQTTNTIIWKSTDNHNQVWFEELFSIQADKTLVAASTHPVSQRLNQILKAAKALNPSFLTTGCHVTSKLNFPRNWGLGSSSTLINNIANWAGVNPYILLQQTFGGSGYDIACAQHGKPLTYNLNNQTRIVKPIAFNPVFQSDLYFVYLNKKQDSREGIASYKAASHYNKKAVAAITAITDQVVTCNNLGEFQDLMERHETIISNIIKQPPVKTRLFPDFPGAIKSLGAWGGDFVLVASTSNPATYFAKKGYKTVLPYTDFIL